MTADRPISATIRRIAALALPMMLARAGLLVMVAVGMFSMNVPLALLVLLVVPPLALVSVLFLDTS